MASRLLWTKGLKEFYEAAKMIKKKYADINFYIVGFIENNENDAISLEQLNSWNLEGIVKFKGISKNIIKDILNSSCIVLPTFYNEGVPRILLEANALSKPVITTNIPGCLDAVEDGYNGFICNPKDSLDLFLKMELLLKLSKDNVEKLGRNGRKKMEIQFDENIVIKKYEKKIKSILKK